MSKNRSTEDSPVSSNELLAALQGMVVAMEQITYQPDNDKGRFYIALHGDEDCTEEVKAAMDKAQAMLGG